MQGGGRWEGRWARRSDREWRGVPWVIREREMEVEGCRRAEKEDVGRSGGVCWAGAVAAGGRRDEEGKR